MASESVFLKGAEELLINVFALLSCGDADSVVLPPSSPGQASNIHCLLHDISTLLAFSITTAFVPLGGAALGLQSSDEMVESIASGKARSRDLAGLILNCVIAV